MIRRLLAVSAIALALAACDATPGTHATDTPNGTHTSAPAGAWHPGMTFHIQYSGDVDLDLPVDVYNLDIDKTTAEQVTELKDRGVKPICYFNAGAFEDFRDDKGRFPREVIGRPLDGWPGEFWLDIRQRDVLLPIMTARMDLCASKGFVAVDPDNTDGWQQDTGFPLSADDQIAYHRALADEAHKRGLAIGLKNNPEQLPEIGPLVDFAVNEQCVQYKECQDYADFLAGGKPVFNIEYHGTITKICRERPTGMSTVLKDRSLSAREESCPPSA